MAGVKWTILTCAVYGSTRIRLLGGLCFTDLAFDAQRDDTKLYSVQNRAQNVYETDGVYAWTVPRPTFFRAQTALPTLLSFAFPNTSLIHTPVSASLSRSIPVV